MSWATAVFLMVLVWGCVTIWSRRHDRELGVTRDEDGNPVFAPRSSEEADADRREIAELRERIQVLERIATDGNSNDARERARIAAEIDALRGTQPGNTTPKPPPEALPSKEDLSE